MQVEFIVTLMMVGFIFVLVGTTPITLESFPLVDWRYVLLPFGPILFALSGWTSIEPAVDAAKKKKSIRIPGLVFGTLGVALVYLLFSLALGSVGKPVTPDTLSGILHLPVWKISILLLFGLSAIITSYLPMSVEVKNALKDGLKWNTSSAFLFALFLPYLLVLAGFNNFLSSIALVGGVFVAIQYMTLTQIARKALKLEGWRKWLANLVSLFFVLAVVAQAVRFLLPILGY